MANDTKDIVQHSVLNGEEKDALPNSTAVLVLGILSIVLCMAYGILGMILGGIGYYLSNKDKELLQLQPNAYTAQSISNMNAGRVCSLIGLIMGGLFFVFIVIVIFIIGMALPIFG